MDAHYKKERIIMKAFLVSSILYFTSVLLSPLELVGTPRYFSVSTCSISPLLTNRYNLGKSILETISFSFSVSYNTNILLVN